MIQPYWQSEDGRYTIYNADCLDVMAEMEDNAVDAIITDPVWPNASVLLKGSDDPYGLFARCASEFPRIATRLVVQLGCDSDPRFLEGVPESLPFFRVCWLDYAVPSYKGRVLYTGDVAYVFGAPPKAKPGAMVLPGKCTSTQHDHEFRRQNGRNKRFTRRDGDLPHPTPRRLQHVTWLVNWYCEESVFEPFLGSGTTGVAAAKLGKRFIGCEVEERFCEFAASRMQKCLTQPLLMRV